ncbi:NACHT domain-containing protein [Siphonobacter sp. SORGH_AS_1065]|uniref:NACHT domain-containing protein n=1 Tax=Siphonobacter sp. SORGH_AS_1065 TaxID=3041795 RepID=UPI0027894FF8|nr:NACHT domain-containing protein [Siphonobacter sp. SORGH_AS_1065]MDQ1086988.1 hypothetical protein [Siphonobacter sp. SORGH_AS_1065]
MNLITQTQISSILDDTSKPVAYSNRGFPLNDLDDRAFEILTYSLFKDRINNHDDELNSYKDAIVMQGVGEKGMDVALLDHSNEIRAIIQCKKYKRNISPEIIIEELIKVSIHSTINSFPLKLSSNQLFYYFGTSTGYTSNSQKLIQDLKRKVYTSKEDITPTINKVLGKYEEFKKTKLEDIINKVKLFLDSLEYIFITPTDYNKWINSYSDTLEIFFEVKKVTDNNLIKETGKEIISKIESIFSGEEEKDITTFISSYSKVSSNKLNSINFIGFDLHRNRQKPTDILLTDLFVKPNFKKNSDSKITKTARIINSKTAYIEEFRNDDLSINDIFNSKKNIIILGDPGAGKSLLVKYIILQILLNNIDEEPLVHFKGWIPFRIELRKYNEVREEKNIIEYLSFVLSKEYQTNISIKLLTAIIEKHNSIIFFDGLDEIFNVNHKNKTKEALEAFINLYPKTKCVVTSRFIGYHDIKFNKSKFDEFSICNFNSKQINLLIDKFYISQINNQEKRKKAIEQCSNQIHSDVSTDLKSNPLILTLILILASNNIVIPESKLEIYEACTNTLVESLDTKDKELIFNLRVKNKRATFAHLAYWQYESSSKENMVSYEKALKLISEFLLKREEVNEYSEAEEISKSFLDYAERRSIYFDNNFTHKTFLEYYTSDYLYINYYTKLSDNARQNLMNIIKQYIDNSFWSIIFELFFFRIDPIQGDNEVLDTIFRELIDLNKLQVSYFLISILNNISNISGSVRRKIIEQTVNFCIDTDSLPDNMISFFSNEDILYKINTLQNHKANFDLLQDIIYTIEDKELDQNRLIKFYKLYYLLNDSFPLKPAVKNNIEIKKIHIDDLCKKDFELFMHHASYNNLIAPGIEHEAGDYFGNNIIFERVQYSIRRNFFKQSLFHIFINKAFKEQNPAFIDSLQMFLKNRKIPRSLYLSNIKKIHFWGKIEDKNHSLVFNLFIACTKKDSKKFIINILKSIKNIEGIYSKYREKNDGNSELDKTLNFIGK